MEVKTQTNYRHTRLVTAKDDKGKKRNVEKGTVEWESSDPTVATVEEDPENEFQGKVTTLAAGTTEIRYKADADVGEGVEHITGFDTFIVTDRRATSLSSEEVGTPEDVEPDE